jgi:hypothetical protein
VTRDWRKLHNEELHNLYSSPSIIRMIKSRRMIWAGHVAQMWEKNAYRILAGKSEGKRPAERTRRKCMDNIKMDLREIYGMLWIGFILSSCTIGGFSRRAQPHE